MFLDLFNDLFINSSLFYVYFGVLLTTIGIHQFGYLRYTMVTTRSEFVIKDCNNVKLDLEGLKKPVFSNESFIVWFIVTFKRIDLPDDDKEDATFSNFIHMLKIRGGQKWAKTTYSPLLKNIVF